ncbi:MAG TPA: 30S ribosomal protein S18 [Exilispira sp.]|jgi:small subunit ribosomal protein S18|nr:30S ribosomal protein S18 [Exilispira sp.]
MDSKYSNEMNRNNSKRRQVFRKKVCVLCKEGIDYVDYKDVGFLQRFIMPVGKILPRRITGTCAKHQRVIADAIKRARIAAFLPYKNV